MNQEYQLLFFRVSEISRSGNQSFMEISRNPSNYLPRMLLFIVIMYLIIEYFMISALWVHSPCPQNCTDCGKKSKVSLCKSYLIWLMEITF